MASPKTIPTTQDVINYINDLPDQRRRDEGFLLLELYKKITKLEPRMWGPSIIGFGSYHYKYESGHEGNAALLAYSPRKQRLVLYVLNNFDNQEDLLQKLGKHKTGKVCLYINKLADVDLVVLKKIVEASWQKASKRRDRTS